MTNSKIPAGDGKCKPHHHHHHPPNEVLVVTPPVYKADYSLAVHKPSINGVVLEGDKSSEELNIFVNFPLVTDEDIDSMFQS